MFYCIDFYALTMNIVIFFVDILRNYAVISLLQSKIVHKKTKNF